MLVKVTIRAELITTKIKELIDNAIAIWPVGTNFHIEVEDNRGPFTKKEMEGMLRTIYGSQNKLISFVSDGGVRYSGEYTVPKRDESEANKLLNEFLQWDHPLDKGEVPPEVLHFIRTYKHHNRKLIEYLNR